MKLPYSLKKYFWDVRFETLDPQKNALYITERLLEHGDERAIAWLLEHLGNARARKVLRTQRGLSPQSANFWASYFKVPRQEVLCLKKSYLKVRKSHWPY